MTLTGIWWAAKHSGGPLQLVGLGVRLAATPKIEDAEGNGQEIQFETGCKYVQIYYHGSYLRIRSEDGMLSRSPDVCTC